MSDEADRIRAYQELARRGQPVPGKNFGKGVPPPKGPSKKKFVPKRIQPVKKQTGGYTVTNRFSKIMLPEKKKTTRIT